MHPFILNSPSPSDIERLRLLISVFRDGTGNQRETASTSRADWRQLERCVAEYVGAIGGEDKQIFDVIAPNKSNNKLFYGLSVKSKQLPIKGFDLLRSTGRVYMEIANSPAKFWDVLNEELSLREDDFRSQKYAEKIGNCILDTVERWHLEGKSNFEKTNANSTLDIASSFYFCISLSQPVDGVETRFRVDTFELKYPKNLIWKYKSSKCLSGFDPSNPSESVVDWYALSGGQLKYYPKAADAKFRSPEFTLHTPEILSITARAKLYWPSEARAANL